VDVDAGAPLQNGQSTLLQADISGPPPSHTHGQAYGWLELTRERFQDSTIRNNGSKIPLVDMTMRFWHSWCCFLIQIVGPARQISRRHECRDSISLPPDCTTCPRLSLLCTVWSQRHNLYQTVITKASNNKPFFKSKQSLPQRYLCVGCQLNSDQALRLLCLKGHVRACGSTLWRHRWQEASQFLCTKKPLWSKLTTKKMAQNPGNALSDALLMSRFQNFAADAAKKKSGFLKLHFRGFDSWINSN